MVPCWKMHGKMPHTSRCYFCPEYLSIVPEAKTVPTRGGGGQGGGGTTRQPLCEAKIGPKRPLLPVRIFKHLQGWYRRKGSFFCMPYYWCSWGKEDMNLHDLLSRPKPPHSHTVAKCGVRIPLRTEEAVSPQQGRGEVQSGCHGESRACSPPWEVGTPGRLEVGQPRFQNTSDHLPGPPCPPTWRPLTSKFTHLRASFMSPLIQVYLESKHGYSIGNQSVWDFVCLPGISKSDQFLFVEEEWAVVEWQSQEVGKSWLQSFDIFFSDGFWVGLVLSLEKTVKIMALPGV